MSIRTITTLAAAVAAAGLSVAAAPGASATAASVISSTGAVYVLGNQTTGNEVLAFNRASNGALTPAGSYPTGGLGTGAGLGSQGAVVLDASNSHVYAVNAGSDTVSSFAVTPTGLRRISVVPSGGDTPISISVRGNRAYVVNAGDDDNISGFQVNNGALKPLVGSTRALSGPDVAPGQVGIAPDGRTVIVTEKGTSLIDVFALNNKGRSYQRTSVPSSGLTPFGFAFTPTGDLAVSEAGPSAVSTYRVAKSGLTTLSASVLNTEAAACWVAVTADGRYTYSGNGGGSQSISGYRVGQKESLSLLDADGKAGTAAAGVSDIALTRDSDFIYARLSDGTVGGYQVGNDGALTSLGVVAGLPLVGSAGIAAS